MSGDATGEVPTTERTRLRLRAGSAGEIESVYNHVCTACTDSDSASEASEDITQVLGSVSIFSKGAPIETVAARERLDARSVIFELLNACSQLGVDIGFQLCRGEKNVFASTASDSAQIVDTVRACARWAVENRVVKPRTRASVSGDLLGSNVRQIVAAGMFIRSKRSRHRRRGGTAREGHFQHAAQQSSELHCCTGGAERRVAVPHGTYQAACEGQGRADPTNYDIALRARKPKGQNDGHDEDEDEDEDEDKNNTRKGDEALADTIPLQYGRHTRRRVSAPSAPGPAISRISADSATWFWSL
jgi:hypothetical protein